MRKLHVYTCIVLAIALVAAGAYADPTSPVTVVDQGSPNPVASGQQLTYTITIQNTAGSKITNVVLSDQLNGVGGIGVPPQLLITSSRGSCSQTTTLVTCNAGTIEGGGVWVVTIAGVVTAPNGTSINNTASVTGTHTAQNFNTTVTTTNTVQGGTGGGPLPDLTVTKNGPSAVAVNSPMTYTLVVNNQGTANATGIKVMDTLPAGLTGITASGTSLFVCSVAGLTVTCTGGQVNAGANATITINATSPSATGSITNTAVVDPDNTIPESNEQNNTSAIVNTSVTSAPPPPALAIQLTDNPDPVVPGAVLTYQILVTNTSTGRADDVNIVDGTQGLNASTLSFSNLTVTNGQLGTKGGCTISAPQVKCYVRSLNPGGTIAVTVAGTVIASIGSTLIDTCNVTGNISNAGTSNNATVKTTVMPAVDLTITKADWPDPVCAASWPGSGAPLPAVCRGGLTYTLVVGNTGIQDASNVLVRDPLPAGVVFDNCVVPAGSTCGVDANNVFTANLSTVAHQSTVTVTIVCAAPAQTGTITNTATVDPNNAIFEGDETNNTATQTTTVITGIDLTIAKFDSGPNDPAGFDPIATSGTETYVILVNNLGTQDASNIRVRDTLPSNTVFRDVQSDHGFTCGFANGIVECIGGAIKGTNSNNYVPGTGNNGNPPDTAKITIRIFAQPFAGVMHNEVRVDPLNEIAEADETNNIATQDTVVDSFVTGHGAFNQLTIAKTQTSPDKTNTARNAKVTWLIKVGNTGTDTAVGVTVRDYLMAGARYIEATGTNKFNCNQIGGSTGYIDCVGGEIASGAMATITLTAFAPDTPGTYQNQAVADPDNKIPEGDELDNQAFETTVVKNGGLGAFYELSLTNTQTSPDKTNTARNAVVTYSLVVTNSGTDTPNGVTVQDTLPAGSRFISANAPASTQFQCSNAGVVVTCVNGVVAGGGGTATITITAFAPDTPGTYTNNGIVDPMNTIPEGDETNNQAQETTVVANGGLGAFNDLTIAMTGTANTTPGGQITYNITVGNTGSNDALNVAVRDVLPAGETFVSAIDAGGSGGAAFTCSNSSGTVNCIGATIPAGGSRNITIVATAPQQNITLTNEAIADPDNLVPEGNEFNNTATAPTVVAAALNLTIEADGPTSASQSDTTDYTITVHNNTVTAPGQDAIGVVMFDTLPIGLIPLSADTGSGNNWTCTVDQNPINFARCQGDLPAGGQVKITIHVFITAQDGTTLDNNACVDPDNKIVESNENDNCAEQHTFTTGPDKKRPDLFVNKSVDNLSPTPGATLTYHINVQNNGTAKAASPVVVSDTLLTSKVDYLNATSTPSWNCTFASPTVTCQDSGGGLDVGGSVDLTIQVKIKDTATGTIPNTAAVPAASPDPSCGSDCDVETKLGNNSSTVTSTIGSSGIDLYVASIVDAPDPVAPGGTLKYTIVAGNAGTAAVPGAHIDVALPVSGTIVTGKSASNGFTCDGPDGAMHLDCHGDFAAGGTTTITIDQQVLTAPPPPATLTVVATADPTNAIAESDEGNNSQTAVTSVTGSGCVSCVDLVASLLTIDPEPIGTGGGSGPATITFVVANVGDTATSAFDKNASTPNALLSLEWTADTDVPFVAPTSSDPTTFPCKIDTPLFGPTNSVHASCTGNLGPNSVMKVTVSGVVTGSSLTVTGVADPSHKQTEANESNNQLVQTAVINP